MFVFFLVIFFFFVFVFFFVYLAEKRTKCIKVFVTIIKGTFSKAHIITFQKRKALFSNCRPTSLAVENPKLPSGKQEELVKATMAKHTLSRTVKTFPRLIRPKTHFEKKKKERIYALEIFQDMMSLVWPGKLPRGEGVKEAAAAAETFPTPMEEPRKVIKAWYLGSQQVNAIIIVIIIIIIVTTADLRWFYLHPQGFKSRWDGHSERSNCRENGNGENIEY